MSFLSILKKYTKDGLKQGAYISEEDSSILLPCSLFLVRHYIESQDKEEH